MKSVAIISGSMMTSKAIKEQLIEYSTVFNDAKLYGVDDSFPKSVDGDVVIYSSDILYDELRDTEHRVSARKEIIAERTIDFDKVEDLFKIRKGERVYVVNDNQVTTMKFIEHLSNIGLEDIIMVPYYPGIKTDYSIRYAIMPGYVSDVPKKIDTVIDIGPRLLGIETIHEVLMETEVIDTLKATYSESYLSKIVNITKNSARYAFELSLLNEQLNKILSEVDEGIMVIDKQNKINVINKRIIDFFNIPYKNYVGEVIDQVVANKEVLDFCFGLKSSNEAFFKLNHVNLVFSRQKLSSGDSIIFVKNMEERILESNRLNQELLKKGHVAKYHFRHLIGQSKAIVEAKYIAEKLAASELTILLEGESGTGKELFASAIHNASARKNKAYLAINFSAFTDELIESELFGYEGGAFTGAKKGGKVGLFEMANGGTLMLDEIGDISPKMQTKLLRVLQEREIIRIGGTIIRSVDVRIIAATNKDLRKMVDEGTFREDLYYRLKMGRITVPPLRERRADIPDLIEHFLLGEYTMTDETVDMMTRYQWRGNIRELRGTIEYMKAISEGSRITLRELPKEVVTKGPKRQFINHEERAILEKVYSLNRQGVSCGRQRVQRETYDELGLSENQVRLRMAKLTEKGYIKSLAGRSGAVVTELGVELIGDM